MKYTSKSSDWTIYEGVQVPQEDGTTKQETVSHSWTKGKAYNITLDKTNDTIQFESDNGKSGVIPILSCNKDAMLAVFNIDINEMIAHAIAKQQESLAEEYAQL